MLKVNPNRMELLKLRKRLVIARRGHKLLKDKLDELMRHFLEVLNEMGVLRKEVEGELSQYYLLADRTFSRSPAGLLEEVLQIPQFDLEVAEEKKVVLNLPLPRYQINLQERPLSYSLSQTPILFDQAISRFRILIERLFQLAALEKSLFLLAGEIEKTKRRVNALENTVIPQLEEAIKFITQKLDEMDRETRTRLMKVKEMLESAAS